MQKLFRTAVLSLIIALAPTYSMASTTSLPVSFTKASNEQKADFHKFVFSHLSSTRQFNSLLKRFLDKKSAGEFENGFNELGNHKMPLMDTIGPAKLVFKDGGKKYAIELKDAKKMTFLVNGQVWNFEPRSSVGQNLEKLKIALERSGAKKTALGYPLSVPFTLPLVGENAHAILPIIWIALGAAYYLVGMATDASCMEETTARRDSTLTSNTIGASCAIAGGLWPAYIAAKALGGLSTPGEKAVTGEVKSFKCGGDAQVAVTIQFENMCSVDVVIPNLKTPADPGFDYTLNPKNVKIPEIDPSSKEQPQALSRVCKYKAEGTLGPTGAITKVDGEKITDLQPAQKEFAEHMEPLSAVITSWQKLCADPKMAEQINSGAWKVAEPENKAGTKAVKQTTAQDAEQSSENNSSFEANPDSKEIAPAGQSGPTKQ